MDTVPREYQNAILFAVLPNKRSVGIKIFAEPYASDMNGNVLDDLEEYVDRCIEKSIELKQSVECGMLTHDDLGKHPKIIQNPSTNCVDMQHLVQLREQKIVQLLALKNENNFIDLGRSLVQSIRAGHLSFNTCKICLGEMRSLSKGALTPLMLKKNPHTVQWVAKLCRYSEYSLQDNERLSTKSKNVRSLAKATLNAFKTVMNYNASNEQFMIWYFNSVKLFEDLTRNLSDIERRQLTIDPEIDFLKQNVF